MATEWYYQVMGETLGPLSSAQLREKTLSGEIIPDTWVRKGAQGKWVAADHVKGLFGQSQVRPPPKPPSVERAGQIDWQSHTKDAELQGNETEPHHSSVVPDAEEMKARTTLKPCRDCGRSVSHEAQACPHCGAAAPTREKSAQWVPCPKCGSGKTLKIGPGPLGFASLVMGSCLLWIPLIGWVLAPFFLVGAVVLWVSALVPSGKLSFKCQSCKQWFRVPKRELETGGGKGIGQTSTLAGSVVRVAAGVVVVMAGLLGILVLYIKYTDTGSRVPLSSPSVNKQDAAATISHTVLNEDISEKPGKTQIKMDILVSEEASDSELRTLLKSLYQEAGSRTGFKYHTHPTVVAIYAYPSREHAESGVGQWSAMLTKSPMDQEPKISIDISVSLDDTAEAFRFGYSLDERKEIYKGIVEAGDRGGKEAEKRYPSQDTDELAEMQRRFDYADEIADKYKNELAKELELSREQLEEIGREGLINNWAMPRMSP